MTIQQEASSLIKDIRPYYAKPFVDEDDSLRTTRLSVLKRIVESQIREGDIAKYIPFDKSHCIRMTLLDAFYLNKNSSSIFDDRLISDDLIALKIAVEQWINNENAIFVGESGTLFRFFQYAIWKNNFDMAIECRGTLVNRPITRDKNIINLSQEELLKLDNGTSQWASAKVLLGDIHRIDNPPFKLKLTYDCVDKWNDNNQWQPITDDTITKQALYFYNLIRGTPIEFAIEQSEDYCFAYMFGLITKKEATVRWPSLQSHETNRILEMDWNITKMKAGEKIPSKDHRVVQAIAMWAKLNNKKVEFEHAEAVFKSWPFFWSFMENF